MNLTCMRKKPQCLDTQTQRKHAYPAHSTTATSTPVLLAWLNNRLIAFPPLKPNIMSQLGEPLMDKQGTYPKPPPHLPPGSQTEASELSALITGTFATQLLSICCRYSAVYHYVSVRLKVWGTLQDLDLCLNQQQFINAGEICVTVVCVCESLCVCEWVLWSCCPSISGNKNKREDCDAWIASSVSLRSTVIVSLFSPNWSPTLPLAILSVPALISSLFIRRLPPSVALVSSAQSIIVIAYSSESPLPPSPHRSSHHPSLPFVHLSWSWIIPFSLPRLSLFVSLSSLLSPASSSLLSFLNPNAVSSSKCCWINHKESMNPCVFGDFLPYFRCQKGGLVIGKCTSAHRIARLQLYLWFGC